MSFKTSRGSSVADPVAQSGEVRCVSRSSRLGTGAGSSKPRKWRHSLVLADQLPNDSLLVPKPRPLTCSSTKDFSASGREMFIVLMTTC